MWLVMRRAVIRRAVICWLVLGGLGSRLTEAVRSGVVVGGPAVDELLDGCVHFLAHRAEPQPSVVATREGHDFNLTGFTFVHVPVATCCILLTQFCMEVNFAVLLYSVLWSLFDYICLSVPFTAASLHKLRHKTQHGFAIMGQS